MSYGNPIPGAGDWEEVATYTENGAASPINLFENYALHVFYRDAEDIPEGGTREIFKMSKLASATDPDLKTWLFAEDEINGQFRIKARREIMETIADGVPLYGIFYFQLSGEADYDGGVFRAATGKIPLGTIDGELTTSNLTV